MSCTLELHVQVPRAEKQPSPEGISLAALLKQGILQNSPNARITPAQERGWALEADLMLRRDRRTEQQIRQLIEWSQGDPFWRANVLSMGKVREKFDQLSLKSQQPTSLSNGRPTPQPPSLELTEEGRRIYQQHGIDPRRVE